MNSFEATGRSCLVRWLTPLINILLKLNKYIFNNRLYESQCRSGLGGEKEKKIHSERLNPCLLAQVRFQRFVSACFPFLRTGPHSLLLPVLVKKNRHIVCPSSSILPSSILIPWKHRGFDPSIIRFAFSVTGFTIWSCGSSSSSPVASYNLKLWLNKPRFLFRTDSLL